MKDRRTFLKAAGLLSGAAILPWQNTLAALFLQSKQAYSMNSLRKGVGYFTERGGTIGWMISKDGIVVVDAQYPKQAGHLIKELQSRSDREITTLYNTHHHGDHTGGNIAFKGIAGKIAAHKNSKKNQMNSAKSRDTEDAQLYPDTLYETGWSESVGTENIRLYYWGKAHTDGDSLIHFENANIVHMGDLIFNRRFPYIDTGAGASIKNWIAVLEKTGNYFNRDTQFIFGHSGESFSVTGNLDDIKAMQNYLTKLLAFVTKKKKAGLSLDDLKKYKEIPGAEEWQGGGIERSFDAAWLELNNNQL